MRIRFGLLVSLATIVLHTLASCGDNKDYAALCRDLSVAADSSSRMHLAIYLDVRSCLACCEDMEAWQELEQRFAECNVAFSLWAPKEDSVDVAVAMELEGLKTPVRVIGDKIVKKLKWDYYTPPIKALFDGECNLVDVRGPAEGATDSRLLIDSLLSELCPRDSVD
jgi:hypothetical protein